jgi:hypothetical protein
MEARIERLARNIGDLQKIVHDSSHVSTVCGPPSSQSTPSALLDKLGSLLSSAVNRVYNIGFRVGRTLFAP